MDENAIFQGNQQPQPPPSAGSSQPPPSAPVSPPPAVPPTAPVSGGASAPPPSPIEEESMFSKSLLLKIIGGVLILLLIIFGLFRFVIPLFGKDKNEKITIEYWGLWEEPRVMQTVINDFQKENPTVTVKYSRQKIEQYRERLVTHIQEGKGPDVFRFHNTWLPQLGERLLPLPTDVISPEEFKKNYYSVIQSDISRDGAIYGIPLEVDTLSLFVNAEILEAAGADIPTNWDEFSRVSRSLTVKDESGKIKTAGAAIGTYANVTHAPDIVSLLLVQNGADLKNLSKTPKSSSDALNFYTSFADDEANVWDNTLDPSILAFSKGNLGMFFGYSYDVFTIKALNPTLSFRIVPVPHLPGRNMTIASYWVEGASAKSKHQKEALLFMRYLAKKETQQKLFTESSKTRLFGEPYSRKDLSSLLKENALVFPFVSQAENGASSFFASNTYDKGLNDEMNKYLENAINSVLSNTSAQTAVDTLSLGVSQILERYGEE